MIGEESNVSCPAPAAPQGSPDPDCASARRLYLTRRRREILAPVLAIQDILNDLISDGFIRSCPAVLGDLETIGTSTEQLHDILHQALDPAVLGGGTASSALNHDARNFLAIVLGYADELRQSAGSAVPERFVAEFDQLRSLGKRALALVDSTVVHLRSPDGVAVADDLQTYLDRGDCDRPAPESGVETSTEPGLILVVEDNDQVRQLLCDLLRRQGHEVIAARDGYEGLTLVGTRPFDLVITDIEMPRVNGLQFLEYLKSRDTLRDIPVVVVSGNGELDSICGSIKAGAEDYLPKPYNQVILKARVDTCLEKKRLRDRNEQQRRRYDELLHSILPAPIVTELSETGTVRPRRRDRVAVLFADIVGFTPFCNQRQAQPEVIVHYLRQVFEDWEQLANNLGLLKIKTIGDAFMAAGGLLSDAENPVLDCVQCGLQMIRATRALADDAGKCVGWDLRVGVHMGPVVAGVLGRRQSLLDLWGDTVNIAARLESHGIPGHVNLSETAWDSVSGLIQGETRSRRKLKGTETEREVIHLDPDAVQIRHLESVHAAEETGSPGTW